jgi:pathogenesis-related protein 1
MRSILLVLVLYFMLVGGFCQPLTLVQKDLFVSRHNYWRAMTGAPDLIWSDELEAEAQKYADLLAFRCNVLKHSRNDDYGENLYWGNRNSPVEIVDLWAGERIYYHREKITARGAEKYGHYTQVIWPGTTEVGCAFARCSNSYYYFCVCKYNPAGNYIGQKAVK